MAVLLGIAVSAAWQSFLNPQTIRAFPTPRRALSTCSLAGDWATMASDLEVAREIAMREWREGGGKRASLNGKISQTLEIAQRKLLHVHGQVKAEHTESVRVRDAAMARAEMAEAAAAKAQVTAQDAAVVAQAAEARAVAESEAARVAEAMAAAAEAAANKAQAEVARQAAKVAIAQAATKRDVEQAKAEARGARNEASAANSRAVAAEASASASAAALERTEARLLETEAELREGRRYWAERVGESDDALESAQNHLAKTQRALCVATLTLLQTWARWTCAASFSLSLAPPLI